MMMMVMAILLLLALIWIGPDGGELMDVAFSHIGCVLSSRHHWRPTVAVVLAMAMHIRRHLLLSMMTTMKCRCCWITSW